MSAEKADFAMVVTSGVVSKEAQEVTSKLVEEQGIRVELVDGPMFAALVVDMGLKGVMGSSWPLTA